jgi:hypothetical protein
MESPSKLLPCKVCGMHPSTERRRLDDRGETYRIFCDCCARAGRVTISVFNAGWGEVSYTPGIEHFTPWAAVEMWQRANCALPSDLQEALLAAGIDRSESFFTHGSTEAVQ